MLPLIIITLLILLFLKTTEGSKYAASPQEPSYGNLFLQSKQNFKNSKLLKSLPCDEVLFFTYGP